MDVAISGAGGAVGNVVAPGFEEDQRTLFTHGDGGPDSHTVGHR